ncbi:transporter associated domain-containing protein [Comamonas testosteroni]|jgi:putative hemolysin|nr:transporter associated domain-containing protein [Comamonas testosteroni]WQG69421.1 transporter associated domain-containing protein [Comamonas testosteroni]
MPVAELKARLAIRVLPDEDNGIHNTLAGLFLAESGHLPVPREKVWCRRGILEVVDMDGQGSDKILAVPRSE